MDIFKPIVDFVYRTRSVRKAFEVENPTEPVLASDGCKGIITKSNEDVSRSIDWVTSQRAVILLTSDRIICGKWKIPLSTINTATLVKVKSTFGSGVVLKLETKDGNHFQFGMQNNPDWTTQSALPFKLEEAPIKYSVSSIILRIVLILFFIYWVYEEFLR